MITTKSEREIKLMREAGRIVALAHQAIKPMIMSGVTTKELDAMIEKIILANDATPSFKGYGGFPAAVCTSINHVLVHGIPDDTKLKDGDIISIDIGANFKGYHGDSAWTYAVGMVSDAAKLLLEVTEASLFEGLKYAKPNNRLFDISHAIGRYAMDKGYSLPIEYTGHGIGSSLHEDPAIPNVGMPNTGVLLKPGMTLAIEPMVHIGKPFTKVLPDNWTVVTRDGSLSAHFEHTVVITEEGYDILTTL
jgi:methionyl aminopeptidase